MYQAKGCDFFPVGKGELRRVVCVCVCELPWCFPMITLEVWEQEEIMKMA